MAKGGSGDVLTGIAAGLLAQHSGEQGFSIVPGWGDGSVLGGPELTSMMKKYLSSRDPELYHSIQSKVLPRIQIAKLQMHIQLVVRAVGLHGLAVI